MNLRTNAKDTPNSTLYIDHYEIDFMKCLSTAQYRLGKYFHSLSAAFYIVDRE